MKSSLRIRNIQKLDQVAVSVTEHETLNKIKGTIRYKNQPRYKTEEILDALKEQRVVELHRVNKKVGSETIPTSIYIVTFECCHLPQEITIWWTRCLVREYIPKPRRCFKCHKFGHGRVTCPSETAICVRCNLEAHEERCDREPMCSNCGHGHPASSRDCFYYNLEQETLRIQTKERVSYVEAKRAARDSLLKPNSRTYADITIGRKRNPGTLHGEKKQTVSHIQDKTQTPQINIMQANTTPKHPKPK